MDDWDIYEARIDTLGMTTGIYAAYDYMGNGDQGGACCMGHRGLHGKSHVRTPAGSYFA